MMLNKKSAGNSIETRDPILRIISIALIVGIQTTLTMLYVLILITVMLLRTSRNIK